MAREKKQDSFYQNGRDIRYSDEQYSKFRQYQKKWLAENTLSVHLHFNTLYDADIVEWIGRQENKQGYIRDLIRRDIEQETGRAGRAIAKRRSRNKRGKRARRIRRRFGFNPR